MVEREVKLKEEIAALQTSILAKDAELIQEHRRAANLAAKLERSEKLQQIAEDKAQAAEGWAAIVEEEKASAIARVVEEYKDSKDFEKDAADVAVNVYEVGFTNCLKKVAKTFPGLDVKRIPIPEGEVEEGEGAGSQSTGTKEAALKNNLSKLINVESPEPLAALEE